MNPTITFLIGPPASGKSTYRDKYATNEVIISRDDIRDELREKDGISYNETFYDNVFEKRVNLILQYNISEAIKHRKDMIVDMSNISVSSRRKTMSRIPGIYNRKAVVFQVKYDELVIRMKNRAEKTGKYIPIKILDWMIEQYEEPSEEENFSDVQYIK